MKSNIPFSEIDNVYSFYFESKYNKCNIFNIIYNDFWKSYHKINDKNKLFQLIEKYFIANNLNYKISLSNIKDFYSFNVVILYFIYNLDTFVVDTIKFWDSNCMNIRKNYEFLAWLKYILETL